jgi:hypothetical protein
MKTIACVALAAACAALGGCSSYEERGPTPGTLFPRQKNEIMSEEAIARALDAPVALRLPARVLVVSAEEVTGSGRGRDASRTLAAALADGLADSAYFQPTLAAPLADGPGGQADAATPIQRLREKAARYRTPYALVAFADFEGETAATPLALLYAPLVTMFFVPGERVVARGTTQAVLVDVRTGVIVASCAAEEEKSDWFVRTFHTYEARYALEHDIAEAAGPLLARKLDRAGRQALAPRAASSAESALPAR